MPVEDPVFSGDQVRHDGLKLMLFLTCPPFKMSCWICASIKIAIYGPFEPGFIIRNALVRALSVCLAVDLLDVHVVA